METLFKVYFSKFAEKQVSKIPIYIAESLQFWISAVEEKGLGEVRKIPGYHDEPLKGSRLG